MYANTLQTITVRRLSTLPTTISGKLRFHFCVENQLAVKADSSKTFGIHSYTPAVSETLLLGIWNAHMIADNTANWVIKLIFKQ